MKYMLVFLGGGMGSVIRYITGKYLNAVSDIPFPVATITVNALSSLALGFIAAHYLQRPQADSMWLLLAVGFCGGFSTFSAFTLELFQFVRNGMMGLALLNIAMSIGVCLLALWAGFVIGKN
jgi:CrcB protein